MLENYADPHHRILSDALLKPCETLPYILLTSLSLQCKAAVAVPQ